MNIVRPNKTLVRFVLLTCILITSCGPKPITTARTIRSLVSVPTNVDEYSSIFKRQASQSRLEAVERNAAKFERSGALLLDSSQQLRNQLANDTSDIVLLVGHNAQGNFMLPDGSWIPFQEINDLTTRNRIVILISCNSNDYTISNSGIVGIPRVIDYDQAYSIHTTLLENLGGRTDLNLETSYDYSVDVVEQIVVSADRQALVAKYGPYGVAGAAAGGGTVTYFIVSLDT